MSRERSTPRRLPGRERARCSQARVTMNSVLVGQANRASIAAASVGLTSIARKASTPKTTAPEASQRTAPSMTRDGLSRSEAETKESSGRAAIWPHREPRARTSPRPWPAAKRREGGEGGCASRSPAALRPRTPASCHPMNFSPPLRPLHQSVRPRRARSMKANGRAAAAVVADGKAADNSKRMSIARDARRGRLRKLNATTRTAKNAPGAASAHRGHP